MVAENGLYVGLGHLEVNTTNTSVLITRKSNEVVGVASEVILRPYNLSQKGYFLW